jgi:UDP-N-acetylmuramoyl-tripeptide--D-alanyl-D-alanine ligase
MVPATWLDDLAAATQGRLQDVTRRPAAVGRLTIDSRDVEPGDVFLALPGAQRDGHDFAADALARGAALVIVRSDHAPAVIGPKLVVADTKAALRHLADWHRRRCDALVIGVTGSVGKTTTRELIYSSLAPHHEGTRSRKNFNNEIGLPLSLLDIRPHHEFAVLELGAARVGDIAHLTELAQPEVGVITAIGSAHLATFGSIEGIMQGKGELLEALPAGGFAVLPGDCPKLRSMAPRAKCRVIFVGEGHDNHLRMTRIERLADGLTFHVDGHRYRLPLVSRHHLTNALCAIAIGREIGLAPQLLAEGLATFQGIPGRAHVKRIGDWTVIDDTYNASPTAFAAALETLRELPRSGSARRIVVAGDMLELGAAARDEHRCLGRRIAESGADRLLVTGDHANDVAQGAIAAGFPSHAIAVASHWDTLLMLLECWLEPGDVVLVKGSRGMRMERVIDWMTSAASQGMPMIELRRSA